MHLTQIHVKVQYGSQTKTHLDKTQPWQNPTVTKPHLDKTQPWQNPTWTKPNSDTPNLDKTPPWQNPTMTKPHLDKTQRGKNPAAHFGLSWQKHFWTETNHYLHNVIRKCRCLIISLMSFAKQKNLNCLSVYNVSNCRCCFSSRNFTPIFSACKTIV